MLILLSKLEVQWLLGPLLIFRDRMSDVSLATLRIICLARGQKRLAPVEEKLALGMCAVRVILKGEAAPLVEHLRGQGYGVTSVPAEGKTGPVYILFTIIPRAETQRVVQIVRQFSPKAFYSVEDVRTASEGVFPYRRRFLDWTWGRLREIRKAK